MDEIPPLRPADQMPPILNDRDLHERWRALMGELGFDDRTLWVTFIEPDGTMVPHIVQVVDLPAYPTGDNLDALVEMCVRALDGIGSEAGFATLLSRPGTSILTDSDRAWAVGTAAAARERGVRTYPMHLATDQAVRVLAPDDLIGAA